LGADPGNRRVAYNLRFHPLLLRLKQWVARHEPVSATIHVGQHLSQWRPDRDFRETYSASRALGGGVLRDLSHELDYALWLFGPWRRAAAFGGRSGALEIDSDDSWSILLECERCPQVMISMNYLDRIPRRSIGVTARAASTSVDLISGSFVASDERQEDPLRLGRDETYRRQHLAMLSTMPDPACTFLEGCGVVHLIESIEEAAAKRAWVEREQGL
jgi:predicted dehydrogenase